MGTLNRRYDQQDENVAIQDFLSWTQRETQTEADGGRRFIPFSKLRAYMTNKDRLRRLLQSLFPDRDGTELPPPELVERHYLRVFSILLCIHRGPFIAQFVMYSSMQDERLPFHAQPPDYPVSSDSNLWDAFYTQQWAFCVPTLEFGMDQRYPDDMVLPIKQKERLAMGGSSVLSKIVVEDEYNQLNSFENLVEEDVKRKNTFVLKTFGGNKAQDNFEKERRAFLKLKTGKRLPSNIIGYYGSFVHNKNVNLILEYADGNLEDFMSSYDPPVTPIDIINLWDNLLGLLRGLALMHGWTAYDADREFTVPGWHQDITPKNILFRSKASRTIYESDFKLADLGLSHFKKKDSRGTMDEDTYGTRAYGAPETFRIDDSMLQARLQVRQDVDIWSLGVVFSELATWMIHGSELLKEYRRRRLEEVKNAVGPEAGDAFHDGHTKLQTVSEIHRHVVSSCRREDPISAHIIDLIDREMIQETGSRSSAVILYNQTRRIVEKAKESMLGPGESDQVFCSSPSPPTLVAESPEYRATKEDHASTVGSTENRSGSFLYHPISTSPLAQSPPEATGNGINHSSHRHRFSNLVSHGSGSQQLHLDASLERYASTGEPNPMAAPVLSVEEALAWKEKTKAGIARFPREEEKWLLNVHTTRDHVFLFDVSGSMQQHRNEVEKLAGLLAYILKQYYTNGITLLSTNSLFKGLADNTKDISRFMERMPLKGTSDMEYSLGRVINEYRFRLKGSQDPQKPFMRRLQLKRTIRSANPKALSIFVFTDGMWQPKNDPFDPILSIARHLRSENLPRSQVGITFIRFGNDPQGIKRLEHLDSSLSTRADPLDIVDVEPHDGNVMKMLLGSFNHWFDEGP